MTGKEDFFYEMPNGTLNPAEVMFTLPNQYTGNMFVSIWLAGLYGVLFIGSVGFTKRVKPSSLFASFGTFIVTFLLVLLSSFTSTPIAGGNQLIPAVILLIANILWNYMGSNGGVI